MKYWLTFTGLHVIIFRMTVTAVGTSYPTVTTPCKTVFERLTEAPFIMKFIVFYGPRKLVVYTTANQWTLSWVTRIHPRLEVLIHSLNHSSYSYWFTHSPILNIHTFVHPEDGGKISIIKVSKYGLGVTSHKTLILSRIKSTLPPPPHFIINFNNTLPYTPVSLVMSSP
jgi:hypothetical protein